MQNNLRGYIKNKYVVEKTYAEANNLIKIMSFNFKILTTTEPINVFILYLIMISTV